MDEGNNKTKYFETSINIPNRYSINLSDVLWSWYTTIKRKLKEKEQGCTLYLELRGFMPQVQQYARDEFHTRNMS